MITHASSTDFITLKANLLTQGISVAPEFPTSLGLKTKEQIPWLFDWNMQSVGKKVPEELCLPDGSVVQIRHRKDSPYKLRYKKEEKIFYIEEPDSFATDVSFLRRPSFYDSVVDGTPLSSFASMRGEDCLSISHSHHCKFFDIGEQCKFCNIGATHKNDALFDIGNFLRYSKMAISSAYTEGIVSHFNFTGGTLEHEEDVVRCIKVAETTKDVLGLEIIPGCAQPTPPLNLNYVKLLYETGIEYVMFNIEIWDEKLFVEHCPGKSSKIGHLKIIEALLHAVNIFGHSRVSTLLISGLESLNTAIKGIEFLGKNGVVAVPIVWSPNVGSLYENHKPIPTEFHITLAKETANVWSTYKLTPPWCYKCIPWGITHDEIRYRNFKN